MASTILPPGADPTLSVSPHAPALRPRRRAQPPPAALVLAALVSALLATAPMWYLLVRAAGAGIGGVLEIMARPAVREGLATSVALAVAVGVGALVLGTGTAWLIARTSVPGRRAWAWLSVMPLAVPSFVAAYSWVSLAPGFQGFWAAVLVLSLATFPYVSLPVFTALARAEAGPEEIAHSLGASRIRVLRTVTLPAVWPAAAAGSLLAALYALSDFGAVALLRVDTLTRSIYASFGAAFDRTTAVVQSLALVLAALVLVWAESRARGTSIRWRVSSGAARPVTRHHLGVGGAAAGLAFLTAIALLSLAVPVVALSRRMGQGLSQGLDLAELGTALMNTAVVSAAGAILAVALALAPALLAARHPGRAARLIDSAIFAGHGLPGVVVGLALVFITLTLVPAAYQTVAALAVAYAILFLPKAIGSARAALAAVPPGLEAVARSQGAGPTRAFATVTGQIAGPGIAAGGLLVMVTAMKELPATLMLRPTGMETLATEMWTRTEVLAFGPAAPYALALVVLAAIPTLVLARSVRPAGSLSRRLAP